jgi:hypothetical protein
MDRVKLAPQWAQKVLEKFGKNPYGGWNFRVIWGPSRQRIIGGFWEDNGHHEYRRKVKYSLDPKWILERWRPAAIYNDPRSWDAQTSTPDGFFALGPFPHHGEYECIQAFSTERGIQGYVPLEPGLIEITARAVVMGKINSFWDIRRALHDEETYKERQQDQKFDDMWDEAQLSRPGLSIGPGGAFNKNAEIQDYERRIERAGAYVDARRFRPGFRQN